MSSKTNIVAPALPQIANYPPGNSTAIETLAAQATADSNNSTWKDPVRVASAASIANLSAVTVANFDGAGQGVTLIAGDRVLVNDTASKDGVEAVAAKRNGIYVTGPVVAGVAPLTRDSDASTSAMMSSGTTVKVTEGTNAGYSFTLTTVNPIVLDTTALTFGIAGNAAQINGVAVPASPAAGTVLLAVSAAAAVWTNQGPARKNARNLVVTNVASLAAYTVTSGAQNDNVSGGNVAGDRVLLVAQTTVAQNGLYAVGTVTGTTAPLTRVADAPAGMVGPQGAEVLIQESGGVFANTIWFATRTSGWTVGTNDPAFYPRRYVRVTTAMAGTPGTKTLSAEWILSTTGSTVDAVVITPGTQGNLSTGALTAGPGTGAVTITSTANETSTLRVKFEN